MHDLKDFILAFKKTRINMSEMEDLYGDYPSLYQAVDRAVQEGLLSPVKQSKLNGRIPPLYQRYHITASNNIGNEIIESIHSLPLGLDLRYYLAHPKEFQEYYTDISKFASFWQSKRPMLSIACAINERSYQIFGQEKYLHGPGKQVVANLGVTLDMLHCYDTPEPFFFVPKQSRQNNALIIENKDTFHTLRLRLEGELLGVSYKYLIYGEGKKILKSFLFLKEIADDNIDTVYYFGDIDLEGINIYLKLHEFTEYKVLPHVKAYTKALCLAQKPYQSSPYHKVNITPFLAHFCLPVARRLRNVLESGCRIPQEALSNYHICCRR